MNLQNTSLQNIKEDNKEKKSNDKKVTQIKKEKKESLRDEKIVKIQEIKKKNPLIHVEFSLDLAPNQRWSAIWENPKLQEAKKQLKKFLQKLDVIIRKKKLFFVFRYLAHRFEKKLRKEYNDYLQEIQDLSELLDYPKEILLVLQFVYEFGARCTSIIFETHEGEWCHFRTLDWAMVFLRDCTVCFDVMCEKKLLYSNVSFLGYVGSFTGQRPFQYSVALNYRPLHEEHDHNKVISIWLVLKNIQRSLKQGTQLNGWAVRSALESCSTYLHIVQHLERVTFSAACYLMVCGAHGGTRLVRAQNPQKTYLFTPRYLLENLIHNPKNVHLQSQLYTEAFTRSFLQYSVTTVTSTSRSQPYLIQTNIDPAHFQFISQLKKKWPTLDLSCNDLILFSLTRWNQSQKFLSKYLQKKIPIQTLIQKWLQFPIQNPKTIFWVLFQPAQNVLI